MGGFDEIVLNLFYEIGYNYLLGGFEEFVLNLFVEIGYNYSVAWFDEIVLNLFVAIVLVLLGGFENILLPGLMKLY